MFRPIYRPICRAIASALTQSMPGGFNPASLFADGSKGVVYDNNDLSSFYLDSAGTTAATVNGLVGLQLDKSQGLVLGAELVSNPTFASSSGWTLGGTTTIAGGKLLPTSVPSGNTIAIASSVGNTVIGIFYQITIVIDSLAAGAIDITSGGSVYRVSAPGTITMTLLATTASSVFLQSAVATTTAVISQFSVKQLPGNHRYQTTTGSKPVLRGTPTGANTVSNPNFDTDTLWSKGAGWTIGSGVATATAATGFLAATMATAVVASKVYRVTYTITRTAGSVAPNIGGITGTSRSASGTYVDYITAFNTGAFVMSPTTFSGTVDNIEVVDVSAGSVTAPYGLQYDLVDDVLLTASIDFSATDSVYASFGVHKFSDSAAQCFMELTASSAANPGFAIFAPQAAAANYEFRSRGTLAASAVATTYTAPIRNVVSGSADISTDTCILRVNGAQVATSASDQGTGNYSNAVLYFGRRGGSTNPFGGLDFGGVLVGKTLTDNQMASVDRYVNQRTGAY